MRKISYALLFAGTFIAVMLLLTPMHSLASSDLALEDVHEVDFEGFHELFSWTFDGENVYYLNATSEGFVIVKLNLNWNVIETYDLDLSSNNYYTYGSYLESSGNVIYLLLENTSDWYNLFVYDLNDNTLEKTMDFNSSNIPGYLLGMESFNGTLYIASIEYLSSSLANVKLAPLAEKSILHLYKLDIEEKTITEIETLSSETYDFVSYVSSFVYLKDGFVFGTSNLGLFTIDGTLLRNMTEAGDIPEYRVPEGYNATYNEVYLSLLDSSPNNEKLLAGVFRYVYLESGESSEYVNKLYILTYTTVPKEALIPIEQPDVSEPVTASSVAISTASAVVVTATVGTVATTAGSAGVSTAGAGSAAGATTASVGGTVSASVATGSFDANRLFGRYGKYGTNLGKYALKLFRRKKKKGEEEVTFEKPSLIKFMVYLAIISGAITGVFMFLKQGILSELMVALSTLLTGIGFTFGGFGLLTGYLFIRGIKVGVLPRATTFVKLSLIASVIGGAYGIITSGLKLTGAFGLIVIGVAVLLLVVAIAFAYAAYMMTLNIYGAGEE